MIGYYLFIAFEKFLMLLPKSFRRAIFIGLGHFAYWFPTRYKDVVRENIKFVYGEEATDEFIIETTKYSFKLLLLNFLHTIEGRHYSIEELSQNVTFENREIVEQVQKEGRPIVFITSHYGAWELGGSMLSALIEPVLIVYKKMKNKKFENYLLGSRAKWRINYVERHGATRGMLKQLKANKAIAILIDTNVSKKESIKVDFLNHSVSQIKTTAYFARKFDAALIPVLIHTDDDKNYTIKFYDEIVPPKTDDADEDIKVSTQMQTDWLSKEILKSPKPWFWLHRRFKADYPEIYTKK